MHVQCSRCTHFTLRDQPHKALEMFKCPQMPAWQFFNPFVGRECSKFEPVPADKLSARIKFEEGR